MTTAATTIDAVDTRLLELLQQSVPVIDHPFSAIGKIIGEKERAVIARVERLKQDKIIRQISAIFDTRSLGYASSLVAAQIDPARVDEAAAVISQHPGVSHNYLRNHAYNLWYTIAVAPTSRFGLERTVALLHRDSGATATRLLPTLKLYKIGVQFDLGGAGRPDDQAAPAYTDSDRPAPASLTPREIKFIRLMQRDLPITPTPFIDYARALGIPLEELAALHQQFLADGRLRRFAAVLHHRRAGFSANAMGVWAAPTTAAAELDQLGETMAGFRAVSHCYRRPTYPDWPYNLFTMIHGKNAAECEQTLFAISQKTGIGDYQALYSTKEYKKARVVYFHADEARWEAARR